MEAIILTLDVACIVYLCWRVYKTSNAKGDVQDHLGDGKGLGWFAWRKDGNA